MLASVDRREPLLPRISRSGPSRVADLPCLGVGSHSSLRCTTTQRRVKSAASEGPDGDIQGSRGPTIHGCATWTSLLEPHYNKLCTAHHEYRNTGCCFGSSRDRFKPSSNNLILSCKDTLQRTGCESIENNRAHEEVVGAGGTAPHG